MLFPYTRLCSLWGSRLGEQPYLKGGLCHTRREVPSFPPGPARTQDWLCPRTPGRIPCGPAQPPGEQTRDPNTCQVGGGGAAGLGTPGTMSGRLPTLYGYVRARWPWVPGRLSSWRPLPGILDVEIHLLRSCSMFSSRLWVCEGDQGKQSPPPEAPVGWKSTGFRLLCVHLTTGAGGAPAAMGKCGRYTETRTTRSRDNRAQPQGCTMGVDEVLAIVGIGNTVGKDADPQG